MTPWLILLVAGAVVAGMGFFLLVTSRRRTRLSGKKGGRRWGRVLFGVLLLLAGLLACGLGGSLRNYRAFAGEAEIARIALKQTGIQRYRAELSTSEMVRTFDLAGDEWQLDARIVNWKLPAQLMGVPPLYALQRLSGRYGDAKQELDAPRTVFDLHTASGMDLWQLKKQYPKVLPFVDAQFGSAAYLPMLDGASYTITLGTRGGVVARPADAATKHLLRESGWLQE